jgi:hypothetical protein
MIFSAASANTWRSPRPSRSRHRAAPLSCFDPGRGRTPDQGTSTRASVPAERASGPPPRPGRPRFPLPEARFREVAARHWRGGSSMEFTAVARGRSGSEAPVEKPVDKWHQACLNDPGRVGSAWRLLLEALPKRRWPWTVECPPAARRRSAWPLVERSMP